MIPGQMTGWCTKDSNVFRVVIRPVRTKRPSETTTKPAPLSICCLQPVGQNSFQTQQAVVKFSGMAEEKSYGACFSGDDRYWKLSLPTAAIRHPVHA